MTYFRLEVLNSSEAIRMPRGARPSKSQRYSSECRSDPTHMNAASPYDQGSNNFKPFVYWTDLPGISATVHLHFVNNTWPPFWDGEVIWLRYSKRMCKLCCIRVSKLYLVFFYEEMF